jgi:hypothetical protein
MPRFDKGCSKFLNQRKQAELQWLQDPSEINRINLNNTKRKANKHFSNKKRDLKGKINELATNKQEQQRPV